MLLKGWLTLDKPKESACWEYIWQGFGFFFRPWHQDSRITILSWMMVPFGFMVVYWKYTESNSFLGFSNWPQRQLVDCELHYRVSETEEQSRLFRARKISTFSKGSRGDSEGAEMLINSGQCISVLPVGNTVFAASLICSCRNFVLKHWVAWLTTSFTALPMIVILHLSIWFDVLNFSAKSSPTFLLSVMFFGFSVSLIYRDSVDIWMRYWEIIKVKRTMAVYHVWEISPLSDFSLNSSPSPRASSPQMRKRFFK